MKVILTQELKGRGGEGDIVDVARGFAVNYLLPRKFAIPATAGNVKQLEQRMHHIKKREDSRLTGADSFAKALDGKTIVIEVKVGDGGRLFGSVTAPQVAEAITAQLGVEVDRRKVETHGHIKTLGSHDVSVAIYRDVKAELTLEVVAEGSTAPAVVAEEVAEAIAQEVIAEDTDAVAVEVAVEVDEAGDVVAVEIEVEEVQE